MRYDQPFWVGVNNVRFPHRSIDGYLRALESKELPEDTDKLEEPWIKSQWDYIRQLKAQVLFLSSKVNKTRANASKGKPNYTIE